MIVVRSLGAHLHGAATGLADREPVVGRRRPRCSRPGWAISRLLPPMIIARPLFPIGWFPRYRESSATMMAPTTVSAPRIWTDAVILGFFAA
jgi:hypothetical protein